MASQAEQPRLHPRRRPWTTAPPSLASSPRMAQDGSPRPAVSLKKSETFHSPMSPPSGDRDPVVAFRSLPSRSPTCPKSLEAVIAGEERMSSILARIDLSSTSSFDAMSQPQDDMPVPLSFLQGQAPFNATMENTSTHPSMFDAPCFSPPEAPPTIPYGYASDSGLGSSINTSQGAMSEKGKLAAGQLPVQGAEPNGQTPQSAITSSISAFPSNSSDKRSLSLLACEQIAALIMTPILNEGSLKPFHPLVRRIPELVENKEITCLRDLENTLLCFAPRCATSGASFLRFCDFMIQCLHTSLYHINELDQRMPSDRPYSNGYFLDLMEQIRRHAAMINESQTNLRAAGKSVQPALKGGMVNTGHPVKLIAHKNGKPVPTKPKKSPAKRTTLKRDLSVNAADEGAERSMARRRKGEPPMNINHHCDTCNKFFPRPCDVTKHEKTHIRPWKCPDKACRYYKIGWPTEKERDRHINDKHSESPSVYRCLYAPCIYNSKRESNCKQHMEKAHGWVYVRSKKNGKGSRKKSTTATPQSSSRATPASASATLSTPATGYTQSPSEPAVPQVSSNSQFSFADPPAQTGTGDFQLFPQTSPCQGSSSSASAYTGGTGELDPPLASTPWFDAFGPLFEAADPNGLILPELPHNPPMDYCGYASTGSSNLDPPMSDFTPPPPPMDYCGYASTGSSNLDPPMSDFTPPPPPMNYCGYASTGSSNLDPPMPDFTPPPPPMDYGGYTSTDSSNFDPPMDYGGYTSTDNMQSYPEGLCMPDPLAFEQVGNQFNELMESWQMGPAG